MKTGSRLHPVLFSFVILAGLHAQGVHSVITCDSFLPLFLFLLLDFLPFSLPSVLPSSLPPFLPSFFLSFLPSFFIFFLLLPSLFSLFLFAFKNVRGTKVKIDCLRQKKTFEEIEPENNRFVLNRQFSAVNRSTHNGIIFFFSSLKKTVPHPIKGI